ncbi:MAG: hypothetical protein AB8B96_11110 [Lysobacterales bacterium]
MNNGFPRAVIACLLCTLALMPFDNGQAQELVTNGQFDEDAEGWFRFRDARFDPGQDMDGAIDSGAVAITNMNGGNVAFFTNIPVAVVQPYVLVFSVKELFGPTDFIDPVRVLVQYRNTSDCNASNVVSTADRFITPTGSGWSRVPNLSLILDAPAQTACIHLSFRLAESEYPGYFLDGVSLQAEQAVLAQDRLFLDSFE